MSSQDTQLKDEFIGVIAIDKHYVGYVARYKKGDLTQPKPNVLPGLDYKKRLLGRNKEKKEHIKMLIDGIKNEYLFTVKLQELVVAAYEDYGGDLEKLTKYSIAPPQFILIPQDIQDPFVYAMQAHKEESMTAPRQKSSASRSQPDPAKEDGSGTEEKSKSGLGTSYLAGKGYTSPGTSSTNHSGTHQESAVNVEKNGLERASMTNLRKETDSNQDKTASNCSSGSSEECKSVGSEHSTDYTVSTSVRESKQVPYCETSYRNISVGYTTSKQEEKGSTGGDEMLTTLMEAIKGMESRVNNKFDTLMGRIDYIDEKLIDIQQKSSATKSEAFLPPDVPVGYNPSTVTTQSLLYNLHRAPSKASKIENQFFDRLEEKLSSYKKQLQEDVTGPSLVFAINSSRIQADLQRDLKSVNFTGPTLLMIIVPTREPDRTPTRLLSDDLAGFSVESKNCHYLYVDNNNTGLHDCGVNADTVDAVARFISKNQSANK